MDTISKISNVEALACFYSDTAAKILLTGQGFGPDDYGGYNINAMIDFDQAKDIINELSIAINKIAEVNNLTPIKEKTRIQELEGPAK